jgi:hypothetical protein
VTLTVASDAVIDSRDIVVTTPNGESNRLSLHIVAAGECPVSLPVKAAGGPFDARLDYALAASEPTTGFWVAGALRFDGSQFVIDGYLLDFGTFQPLAFPSFGSSVPPNLPDRATYGIVNAFYNPNLCAFNVATIPDAPPGLADALREQFQSVIGLPPGASPMATPR